MNQSGGASFDTNGNRTMSGYVTGPGNQLLSDGTWNYGYLYARALTIGGGTSEVQRNILGEKVLGLPRD